MPYTLCETVENGEKYLVAVPSKWESNSILLYPPKDEKKLFKYKKDEHSQPEVTWERYICTVKANNIANYREAMDLEKLYGDRSTDTEAEERYNGEANKRKRRCVFKSQQPKKQLYDAGHIGTATSVEQSLEGNEDIPAYSNNAENLFAPTVSSAIDHGADCYSYENNSSGKLQMLQVENINSNDSIHYQFLNAKIDAINTKMDIQGKEIAKIQDTLKEILDLVKSNANSWAPTTTDNLFNLENINWPFSTVNQVDEFENKLGDDIFRSQIMKKLTAIGGTQGNDDATKVANKIAKTLFKQELLRDFTWTGKSWKRPKIIPFLKYCRIIQMFYDVVHLASPNYTYRENKNFIIYTMLKYSASRAGRRTKTKKKVQNNNTIITTENVDVDDCGVDMELETDNEVDDGGENVNAEQAHVNKVNSSTNAIVADRECDISLYNEAGGNEVKGIEN